MKEPTMYWGGRVGVSPREERPGHDGGDNRVRGANPVWKDFTG